MGFSVPYDGRKRELWGVHASQQFQTAPSHKRAQTVEVTTRTNWLLQIGGRTIKTNIWIVASRDSTRRTTAHRDRHGQQPDFLLRAMALHCPGGNAEFFGRKTRQ